MVTSDEDTASFTTDSSGQGSRTFGVAVSGWTRPGDGFLYFTTSVTVTAAGKKATVPYPIKCVDPRGK